MLSRVSLASLNIDRMIHNTASELGYFAMHRELCNQWQAISAIFLCKLSFSCTTLMAGELLVLCKLTIKQSRSSITVMLGICYFITEPSCIGFVFVVALYLSYSSFVFQTCPGFIKKKMTKSPWHERVYEKS